MIVLDCESTGSIYRSLQQDFGIDEATIKTTFDILLAKLAYPDMISADELLFSLSEYMETELTFSSTYWFHIGRTVTSATFEEGILPLGEIKDHIWNILFGLLGSFPKKQWLEFKRGMEQDFSIDAPGVRDYRLKTCDEFYWGPFAYLILEAAYYDFYTGQTRTHYWKTPEVTENICHCFEYIYNINLLQLFNENSKPYVVKFIENSWQKDYLEDALLYLYFVHQGNHSDYIPKTGFNGQARRVEPEHIIGFWFVDL